jgi:hypothetical protein
MESILTSIKKLLGIEASDTSFDNDIVMFINGALSNLTQLGVGPSTGYKITGATEVWTAFLGTTRFDLESVKSYVYLKVRLIFDPPQVSYLVDAIKTQIAELEWRINVQVEGGTT